MSDTATESAAIPVPEPVTAAAEAPVMTAAMAAAAVVLPMPISPIPMPGSRIARRVHTRKAAGAAVTPPGPSRRVMHSPHTHMQQPIGGRGNVVHI